MRFQDASFETAAGVSKQLTPSTLPEIAFSGRSNVGKSSLLNKILNRKALARVSSSPGKTVTINFYRLEQARFVDLPGYGYAKVSFSEKKRWGELVEGYFSSKRDLRLVVQLIDMRHPPTRDDVDMLQYLQHHQIPFIIALTKSDKLNKTERSQRLEALKEELSFLDGIPMIPFSATKGEGVEEVKSLIEQAVEG